MTRIRAIIVKEWIEATKNKMILFTLSLLPVLILVIALGTLYVVMQDASLASSSGRDLPALYAGMDPRDAVGLMMVSQYLFLFLVVPASIPVTIASYSIVGEKEHKSLEPLLATPIRTWELLVAKSAAAVIPAILVSWVVFLAFIVGVKFLTRPLVFATVVNPVWLIANLVIGPLLAVLSVLAGVIASSRLNDPRAVQQLVAMFVVPLVLIGIGQSVGLFLVSVEMVLLGALLVVLIDGAVLWLAVRLFQREVILTRWR